MPAEIICDGCGKREKMIHGADGNFHKPHNWFQRNDEDGIQVACSRECVEIISKNTGKPSIILPI